MDEDPGVAIDFNSRRVVYGLAGEDHPQPHHRMSVKHTSIKPSSPLSIRWPCQEEAVVDWDSFRSLLFRITETELQLPDGGITPFPYFYEPKNISFQDRHVATTN